VMELQISVSGTAIDPVLELNHTPRGRDPERVADRRHVSRAVGTDRERAPLRTGGGAGYAESDRSVGGDLIGHRNDRIVSEVPSVLGMGSDGEGRRSAGGGRISGEPVRGNQLSELVVEPDDDGARPRGGPAEHRSLQIGARS